MRTRSLLATAAALSVLLPASAGAATSLPVGEADGVRITQRGARSTLLFTKQAAGLWKRMAGKPVEIACVKVHPGGPGILDHEASGYQLRLPRRRVPLSIDGVAGSDYCTVSRRNERGRLLSFDTIVAVPLTQTGAVLLDEREKAGALMAVLTVAGAVTNGKQPAGFATPAQVTSGRAAKLLRRAGMKIAALAAAGDTPPAGTVGYWSDGGQQVAVVVLSAAGRRLYIELGTDEELRTNVAGAIFGSDE